MCVFSCSMAEPVGSTRTIGLTVYDGAQRSTEQLITIDIINVNDAPVVSLDGSFTPTTVVELTYTEGEGDRILVPEVIVYDTDPSAMIQQ